MSDDQESSSHLLQKLHDEVGPNFPRMFLDFNEFGVLATFLIEMIKVSSPFYSEYSEWAGYHNQILSAFDATVLSSASKDGKMRNSFLIKKFQVQQIGPNMPEKKPGFLDGIGGIFGGKNNSNGDVGQRDMSRL